MSTAFICLACILFGLLLGAFAREWSDYLKKLFDHKQPKPWKPKAYIKKHNQ